MMLISTLFLLLLSAVQAAIFTHDSPSKSSTRFEDGNPISTHWDVVGSPNVDGKIRLHIFFAQSMQPGIEQTLLDIATPRNAKYGKHMSWADVKGILTPNVESLQAVQSWLASAGVTNIHDAGGWLTISLRVSQAEQLLNTTFHLYQSQTGENDVQKIRSDSYHVPDSLRDVIHTIQPTTILSQIEPDQTKQFDPAAFFWGPNLEANMTRCNSTVVPACIRNLYKLEEHRPIVSQQPRNFLGVTGFSEQSAQMDDLFKFLDSYAPDLSNPSFSTEPVNGGRFNQDGDALSQEANLDMQYAMSLAGGIPTTFMSIGGSSESIPTIDHPDIEDQNEPFLDMLVHMLQLPQEELPMTLSTSYGEDEQRVPVRYAQQVCLMLGLLGARGVSVIFSSGDDGVGSDCQTNDGRNQTRFQPRFPASCPWVTSVGATQHVFPESAAPYSSGGFSNLFTRPHWQDAAVHTYLANLGDQWDGLYNRAGRGFPDVAAQGSNFLVMEKGRPMIQDGTSASAPVFAAVIALLNNARLQKGLAPLGFLNPWIYSVAFKAEGFNDIVDGGSRGCTGVAKHSKLQAPMVPYASWNATRGWDPVTGVGTPDFKRLLALAVDDAANTPSPQSTMAYLYDCYASILTTLSKVPWT